MREPHGNLERLPRVLGDAGIVLALSFGGSVSEVRKSLK